MMSTQFLWIAGMGLLGLVVGSFLNVVIARLPKMLYNHSQPDPYNLLFPRSHCPHCQQGIPAFHNIPVLSFIYLRGRCGHCQIPISIRYPLVEIITALLSIVVITQLGVQPYAFSALILVWGLIALSFIDIEHQLLPDDITLPLLWLGLLLNLLGLFQTPLDSAVLGAVFGYLALWLVYWGFKKVTGQEGMGYGDFKLLALLGAWLGWQVLPFIVFLASLLGSSIGGISLILQKKSRHSPLPFGPYLSVAGIITLLYSEKMIQLYSKVFNL